MRARVLVGHKGWQLVEKEREAGRLAQSGQKKQARTLRRTLGDLGLNERKAHYWRRFYELVKERFEDFEVLHDHAQAEGEDLSLRDVLALAKGRITAAKWTRDPESYTPSEYVEAAREAHSGR